MSSEDWKTVLLAFIGVLATAVTTAGSIFGSYIWLRLKAMQQTQTETKTLINGRMDDLLQAARDKAYAEGHAAGMQATAKGVADSPNVPMGVKEMAKVIVDNAIPTLPPAPPKPDSKTIIPPTGT